VKVAVTGGSGVVGSAVVRHAVAAGHEVRALARTAESAQKMEAVGAFPIRGDVLDPSSLTPLTSGADLVFHVAGVNEMCPRHPETMYQVNYLGAWNVMEACRDAGVSRLVHTSSAVAIGEQHGTVGSEESPHRGWYLSAYERSKHLSEKLVLEARPGLEVVVVNPSSVQGPGRATGTGKLVLDVVRGKVPFMVDTIVSIVDIDDCARGHLLAAERGEPGRRYVLNGASLGMGAAIELIRKVTGRQVGERYLPGPIATVAASIAELGSRMIGRRPPLCREMARVLRHGHRYDGSRASRELGLEYRPIEETLRRTIDWFQSEGLLEASR
jgi:dihydroflavonol-4-reductase